jgi:hypothetical protein
VWDQAVASLIAAIKDGRAGDGFVAAIEQCGAVLADHFPLPPGRSIRTSWRTGWWRFSPHTRRGARQRPVLSPHL